MITIIEGPDASGKTTLMKQAWPAYTPLDHGGPTVKNIHVGPPPFEGAWTQYVKLLNQVWHNPTVHHVFDRFIFGELVYPSVMSRPSTFTWAHARMLSRVCLAMEGAVVGALTNLETSKQIWRERQDSEMIQKEERLDKAHELFSDLFMARAGFPLPLIHYDMEMSSAKDIKLSVDRQRAPENCGPGIGMYRPGGILIVGEQINENAAENPAWTFVSNGGSSLWLTERFEEAGICEQQLYWINALDTAGNETSPAFLEELNPATTIALGKSAELWCRRNHVACQAVPHPAFWKRFYAKDPYPLVELLRSL